MNLLVLDANYLCYRAHYSHRNLSFEGARTGCIFGFFREVVQLLRTREPDSIAFCFDYGYNLRKKEDPRYKAGRAALRADQTPSEKAEHEELMKQIDLLRDKLLPSAGFKNVFKQEGYEADDLIASITLSLKKKDRATIVSADHDLYQLIRKNVTVWNLKTEVNLSSFHLEHGVKPKDWAMVKAIAGCASDDVEGVRGVGEKTAAAYIRKDLSSTSKMHGKIEAAESMIKANLKLVTLPYPDTQSCEIRPDKVKRKKWKKMTASHGMKSLSRKTPNCTSGG